MTEQLCVIIVNWNRPADTIDCVRSLLAAGVPETAVLLVDNGSEDESVAQFTTAFPAATLLPLPHNLGFAGGYNAGIEAALQTDAAWLFILNNDTTVATDCLMQLMQGEARIPKILYFDDPKRIWAAGARWRAWPPGVVMRGFQAADNGRFDTPMPLDYATACALLVRRTVFETIGTFAESYGSYMEDYDFCYRLRQAGLPMAYMPKGRVFHKVSLTLGEGSPQKWYYLGRNVTLFMRENGRFSRLT